MLDATTPVIEGWNNLKGMKRLSATQLHPEHLVSHDVNRRHQILQKGILKRIIRRYRP
jgi:hypothetical protein